MSDFCSQCSLFGDEYDIDLFSLAIDLEPGYSETFICEGCENRGVFKDEYGKVYLAKNENGEIALHPVNIEDLMHE